jgi:hypothetical protein
MGLIAATHNLLKLHRYTLAIAPAARCARVDACTSRALGTRVLASGSVGSVRHRHVGVIVMAAVGLGVMVGVTEAEGSEGELVGNRYASISVVRDGESHELVEGTRIRVRSGGRTVMSW